MPHTPLPRIGGFQPWVDTIGGILAHADIPGFLGNTEELYEQADNDALQWAAFLHTWHEAYGEGEKLIAEIVRDIKEAAQENASAGGVDLYNALPDDLADIHKGDLKRRLGKALASRVGSQFDESGLHLEKAATDRRSGAIYWKVAGSQVSQVSLPQKAESSRTNDPPEGLQSDTSAILEGKYFPARWAKTNLRNLQTCKPKRGKPGTIRRSICRRG